MSDTMCTVAIVDYGVGNLFSVAKACRLAGFHTTIAAEAETISRSDIVILPGVGAFREAMQSICRSGAVEGIRDAASNGHLIVGICLGLQLLMTESYEHGRSRGLDLIPGDVRDLYPTGRESLLRVPNVGWRPIYPAQHGGWSHTPLSTTTPGTHMYFTHSYAAHPVDQGHVLATAQRGDDAMCAAIGHENVVGFQFHPELSGPAGIAIYRALRPRLPHPA